MSALYHVKVLEKEGTRVVLGLTIIHPDERDFYQSPGFGLLLLYDRAQTFIYGDNPLGNTVSRLNARDPDWLAEHATEYISSVVVESTANHPASPELDFNEAEREELPFARVAIDVTEEQWIDHLQPGLQYKSSAYDPSGYT